MIMHGSESYCLAVFDKEQPPQCGCVEEEADDVDVEPWAHSVFFFIGK